LAKPVTAGQRIARLGLDLCGRKHGQRLATCPPDDEPGFDDDLADIEELEQNHDRYTRGQCLRVLIFQEINTLKNAFQGTFIVILL